MRTPKHVYNRIPMPARPGTCRLQVQNLSITLEGESILQDISFQLNCREIVALIGPNGAGKSSLFRSILGQVPTPAPSSSTWRGGTPPTPRSATSPRAPALTGATPSASWTSSPPPSAAGRCSSPSPPTCGSG